WRFPKLSTAVLRICYVLGPSKHGTFAAYLRGPRVPTVLGFDPLFQFIHEADAARAIASSVETKLRGVFNVSGPPPTPLSVVIEQTGRTQVAVPALAVNLLLGRFGLPRLPKGAIDHIKYPIVIESGPFREAAGFAPLYDEDQTMSDFRDAR
ncbi:MAG: epimerase, partial [Deltaproteobacteria bacterium]|nr:epimerase [Deltaproteobacteria bacterium]